MYKVVDHSYISHMLSLYRQTTFALYCRASTDSGDGLAGDGLSGTSSVSRPGSAGCLGEGTIVTCEVSSSSIDPEELSLPADAEINSPRISPSAHMQVGSVTDNISRPNSLESFGEDKCEASSRTTDPEELFPHVDPKTNHSAYDIGVLASGEVQVTSVTDTDRYNYLTHEYQGEHFATYEVTKKGKKIPLTFQASWLKEFRWLAYSPSQRGGYCKYCVLFAKIKKGVMGILVKTPFRNFSKAKGKDGYLTTHDSNQFHHDAMLMGKSFLGTYSKPSTRIDNSLDRQCQELSKQNKHILSVIADTVKLCGMQGIPLRGHRDDSTADHMTNRGNFLAILEHAAKTDPVLNTHLEQGKKNQRYTSKTIQNEIIAIIADYLHDKIMAPLKRVPYYSIIADEVTDPHGNQEILSLCLRFFDITGIEPHIREAFINFVHLERATGQGVASAILGLITKHGLDVQYMRGQSYDGASAMAGNQRGAQALIREKNPLALYTHCSSHVLSLAIGKSCSVQALRNMIDIINEVYLFFHLSPKRQRFLELVLSVCAPESRVNKLKGLCKTRWTERHDCLETFHTLYEYIYTALHAMLESQEYPHIKEAGGDKEIWSWDASTRTKAEGLKSSLKTGSNILALVTLLYGLDPLQGLSAKLQKRDADVVAANKHINTAINDVQRQRANFDAVWDEWFQDAEAIAANIGSEIQLPRRSKHQRHRANTPAVTAR